MRAKDMVGAYGEDIAAEHLRRGGLAIVARNWRCEFGELDLIALDGDTVVVCEVKTRTGLGFGSGLEAVGRDKLARLRRLALHWLDESGRRGLDVRVDVLAVRLRRRAEPLVEHVTAARLGALS